MADAYPICDFCGTCEHCPGHGLECLCEPAYCKDCWTYIPYDQPGCYSSICHPEG